MRSSPASIYMYQGELLGSRSVNMLSVTDLSQKESFPGSEFKPASIWTCWMLMDRQNAVSFHAGTSQVDFEVDCPPPVRSTWRSFDHHGKENGNFV